MPDTFDPRYSWFKTWKENPSPPILFYATSCNLLPEIKKHGLTPKMERETNPTAAIKSILSSARKLGDKRIIEEAELTLMEHGERSSESGGLRLTFNYHHAVHLARKKTRRLEAVQWLCETFQKRVGLCEDQELAELTLHRMSYSCQGVCDLYLCPPGMVVYVRTDLSKFQNLPSLIEDKKELKRVLRGKGSFPKDHWPKPPWWKRSTKSETERRLERLIRGDKDYLGLGQEVITVQSIPPSDVIRIELPSNTSVK
jgi:hypothetical protein